MLCALWTVEGAISVPDAGAGSGGERSRCQSCSSTWSPRLLATLPRSFFFLVPSTCLHYLGCSWDIDRDFSFLRFFFVLFVKDRRRVGCTCSVQGLRARSAFSRRDSENVTVLDILFFIYIFIFFIFRVSVGSCAQRLELFSE